MSAWTMERPTKAGAYWNKLPVGYMQIVVVYVSPGGELMVNCQGDTKLENYVGEWQPVVLPQD